MQCKYGGNDQLRQREPASGSTPEKQADVVRAALMASDIYSVAIEGIPVLSIAAVGPMRPERWTMQERVDTITWALGTRALPPKPVADYVAKLKAMTEGDPR